MTTSMSKVIVVPSSAPSSVVAMSTKNACNKENIRSKKYVPAASDDIDENNKPAQCQSPVPVEDKQQLHDELNVKCDEGSEYETGSPNDKRKFIEAPLPKTNPWTANKNVAHVNRSKEPTKDKDPIVGEKRVLQPQQQTSCEYIFLLSNIYVCTFINIP